MTLSDEEGKSLLQRVKMRIDAQSPQRGAGDLSLKERIERLNLTKLQREALLGEPLVQKDTSHKASIENPDESLLKNMSLEEKRKLLNELQKHRSGYDLKNPWIPEKHGRLLMLLSDELGAKV